MKKWIVTLSLVTGILVSALASAEENTQKNQEIGLEQKLARVYELYQKGDAVSLQSHESQVGIGIAYSLRDTEMLGVRESSRILTTQAYLSHGLGKGVEISVALPYLVASEVIATIDTILAKQNIAGIGDSTLRLIKEIPNKESGIAVIIAVSFPWGARELSRNEIRSSLGTNWSKVVRPAFISSGLSWERDFENRVNGIGYRAGLGFFLNHALSIGGELVGVIKLNPEMGSVRDSLTPGIKVAYQTRPDFGTVTTVNLGQTNDVPTTVGITTYWRFR